jgi:hypothetical protein
MKCRKMPSDQEDVVENRSILLEDRDVVIDERSGRCNFRDNFGYDNRLSNGGNDREVPNGFPLRFGIIKPRTFVNNGGVAAAVMRNLLMAGGCLPLLMLATVCLFQEGNSLYLTVAEMQPNHEAGRPKENQGGEEHG